MFTRHQSSCIVVPTLFLATPPQGISSDIEAELKGACDSPYVLDESSSGQTQKDSGLEVSCSLHWSTELSEVEG